jgi:ATP-binding cassette subfamily B multidrug efflux pump
VIEDFMEEEALGKAYDGRLLARLWPYVAPYRVQVLLTLAMVAPLFALELTPAWIIKNGLDVVTHVPEVQRAGDPLAGILTPPAEIPVLVWLVGLLVLVSVCNTALYFCHMLLMATTGQSAMRDLRRDVFDHIQRLHIGFFDRYPVGRLVTRATNDVENVAEMFSAGIVAFVTDVLKMIGIAVVLYLVDAKLALMTFTVVPVLAVAAVVFRLKVREAFRAVRVRIARINAHIQETITGMKVVQLFTREERNFHDFDLLNADHRDAWKESIRYDALLFASVEAAQGVTVAIILWFGTGGVVEAGVLYVFIDYMRRFFLPLRDLSAKYSVMQSSMASSERIFQLLDTQPEVRDPERCVLPAAAEESAKGDGGRRVGSRGMVEFENVWFAYNGEEWVLRDLSLRVEPGEKVALVGATGAGKTTLIKLLTRLYDVNRGRILIDGVDLRDLPQSELRSRVTTVLQDVFLFSGTVADNISLGRPGIDRVAVERAASSVQVDRFIEALPEGYVSQVLERGANLSAGQRQLLSFARAMAAESDVLVLDEATSSIDTETEELIQRGIRLLMEGKTAIAIAHRLSTVRDVDCIYVLHRGQLVESGRHSQLLELGGFYHRLYHLQSELGAGPPTAA